MCIGKVGVRAIATKCSSDVQAVYRNISCSSTSNTVADGNTEPAVQQTHQKHSARKLTETAAPETFIHRSALCSCVSPHTHVEIDLSPANVRLLPVGAKCALFRTAPIAVERRCYNMSSQSSCEFSQEWRFSRAFELHSPVLWQGSAGTQVSPVLLGKPLAEEGRARVFGVLEETYQSLFESSFSWNSELPDLY